MSKCALPHSENIEFNSKVGSCVVNIRSSAGSRDAVTTEFVNANCRSYDLESWTNSHGDSSSPDTFMKDEVAANRFGCGQTSSISRPINVSVVTTFPSHAVDVQWNGRDEGNPSVLAISDNQLFHRTISSVTIIEDYKNYDYFSEVEQLIFSPEGIHCRPSLFGFHDSASFIERSPSSLQSLAQRSKSFAFHLGTSANNLLTRSASTLRRSRSNLSTFKSTNRDAVISDTEPRRNRWKPRLKRWPTNSHTVFTEHGPSNSLPDEFSLEPFDRVNRIARTEFRSSQICSLSQISTGSVSRCEEERLLLEPLSQVSSDPDSAFTIMRHGDMEARVFNAETGVHDVRGSTRSILDIRRSDTDTKLTQAVYNSLPEELWKELTEKAKSTPSVLKRAQAARSVAAVNELAALIARRRGGAACKAAEVMPPTAVDSQPMNPDSLVPDVSQNLLASTAFWWQSSLIPLLEPYKIDGSRHAANGEDAEGAWSKLKSPRLRTKLNINELGKENESDLTCQSSQISMFPTLATRRCDHGIGGIRPSPHSDPPSPSLRLLEPQESTTVAGHGDGSHSHSKDIELAVLSSASNASRDAEAPQRDFDALPRTSNLTLMARLLESAATEATEIGKSSEFLEDAASRMRAILSRKNNSRPGFSFGSTKQVQHQKLEFFKLPVISDKNKSDTSPGPSSSLDSWSSEALIKKALVEDIPLCNYGADEVRPLLSRAAPSPGLLIENPEASGTFLLKRPFGRSTWSAILPLIGIAISLGAYIFYFVHEARSIVLSSHSSKTDNAIFNFLLTQFYWITILCFWVFAGLWMSFVAEKVLERKCQRHIIARSASVMRHSSEPAIRAFYYIILHTFRHVLIFRDTLVPERLKYIERDFFAQVRETHQIFEAMKNVPLRFLLKLVTDGNTKVPYSALFTGCCTGSDLIFSQDKRDINTETLARLLPRSKTGICIPGQTEKQVLKKWQLVPPVENIKLPPPLDSYPAKSALKGTRDATPKSAARWDLHDLSNEVRNISTPSTAPVTPASSPPMSPIGTCQETAVEIEPYRRSVRFAPDVILREDLEERSRDVLETGSTAIPYQSAKRRMSNEPPHDWQSLVKIILDSQDASYNSTVKIPVLSLALILLVVLGSIVGCTMISHSEREVLLAQCCFRLLYIIVTVCVLRYLWLECGDIESRLMERSAVPVRLRLFTKMTMSLINKRIRTVWSRHFLEPLEPFVRGPALNLPEPTVERIAAALSAEASTKRDRLVKAAETALPPSASLSGNGSETTIDILTPDMTQTASQTSVERQEPEKPGPDRSIFTMSVLLSSNLRTLWLYRCCYDNPINGGLLCFFWEAMSVESLMTEASERIQTVKDIIATGLRETLSPAPHNGGDIKMAPVLEGPILTNNYGCGVSNCDDSAATFPELAYQPPKGKSTMDNDEDCLPPSAVVTPEANIGGANVARRQCSSTVIQLLEDLELDSEEALLDLVNAPCCFCGCLIPGSLMRRLIRQCANLFDDVLTKSPRSCRPPFLTEPSGHHNSASSEYLRQQNYANLIYVYAVDSAQGLRRMCDRVAITRSFPSGPPMDVSQLEGYILAKC